MKHEMQGDFLNTPIKQKDTVALNQQRVCPKCRKGFMEGVHGIMLTSMPPQYPHKCTRCRHPENYRETYPRVVYQEKK